MSTVDHLQNIYQKLLNHFGPQKWWPADSAFEVMVGAILTQNTSWTNVEKALSNLKKAGALTPCKIVQLSSKELSELIRPAGYYNVKEKRLRNLVQYFVDQYDGDINLMKERSTSLLREELLNVKGVGQETADSILLYALQKPTFVIDTYTYRILSRHDLCSEDSTYEELQELFMSSMLEDVNLYNEYHAFLVNVGKKYCRPKAPACVECPLNGVNWNAKKV